MPSLSGGLPIADGDVRETLNLQRAAFGEAPMADDEEPRDPRRRGGGAVIARSNGEAVAAASWTPVRDEASEIVGVATAEAWRRRGLAGAVTAAAAREAFAAGASLCVLSPGDARRSGSTRERASAGSRRCCTGATPSERANAAARVPLRRSSGTRRYRGGASGGREPSP